MKKLIIGLGMIAAGTFAHDEGHGPKLTDSPKQGGVLTAVVEAKDAKLGPQAKLVYKAELVRLEDGTVKVYLYTESLEPLDLKTFAPEAKADLITVKRKKVSVKSFDLKVEDDAFVGKAPKASSKPFNIDVKMKEGKRALLAAFDNLD